MTLFSWRHTIDFIAVCTLFGFCFRLNISTSKISNFLLPFGVDGVGSVNLDISYFSLLYLQVLYLNIM